MEPLGYRQDRVTDRTEGEANTILLLASQVSRREVQLKWASEMYPIGRE